MGLFIYGTILSELLRKVFLAALQWKSISPLHSAQRPVTAVDINFKYARAASCVSALSHTGRLSASQLSALGKTRQASLPSKAMCYHQAQDSSREGAPEAVFMGCRPPFFLFLLHTCPCPPAPPGSAPTEVPHPHVLSWSS